MWFFRDSALAGTAVIHCFNTLNNCSASITNPTNQPIAWYCSVTLSHRYETQFILCYIDSKSFDNRHSWIASIIHWIFVDESPISITLKRHCDVILAHYDDVSGTNNCWLPLARKWPTWKWTWIWIPYGKIEKKCPRYFRRDSRGNPRDLNMCRTGRSAALSRGRKPMPPRSESMKLVVQQRKFM